MPMVENIISYAKDEQKLVCIDDAATGACHGDYGQSHMISLLTTECENQCIPHVLVPPKYTSRYYAPLNLIIDPKYRSKNKQTIEYNGLTLDADELGAENVGLFGYKIWSEGWKSFELWRNSIPLT